MHLDSSRFWEVLATFGKYTTYFYVRTGVVIAIGLWVLLKTKWGQRRRVFQIPYKKEQFKRELLVNLKIIPVYSAWVTFLTATALAKLAPPTLFNTLFTMVLLYWWNELWFYGLHRVMHTKRFYWMHRPHHDSLVTNPLSFMVFSVSEQSLHMILGSFLPALVSHVIPLSMEGLLLYGVFQLFVNLLGHMNVEIFPAGYAKKWFGVIQNTPTYHALHHARLSGNYGMQTAWLDKLFGTYYGDYPAIQERAASGRGLTRLSETVAETVPETVSKTVMEDPINALSHAISLESTPAPELI